MDEKVSNLFNSWGEFKEKVKSKIPERYTEAAEKIRINRRRSTNRSTEHEMGTFKSFDRPENPNPFVEGFSEYQEGGEGQSNGYYGTTGDLEQYDAHTGCRGKISAWQAGWNVTNAIQVRISFFENNVVI